MWSRPTNTDAMQTNAGIRSNKNHGEGKFTVLRACPCPRQIKTLLGKCMQ